MTDIKTYTFEFYPTGNPPGWWDYEFTSDDLSLASNKSFFNERDCFEAVILEENLADEDTCRIMTVYELERLLLDNLIYVKFIEGDEL